MVFIFENGTHVKDKITGFSGAVTGRADYISGCNQYLIRPTKTTKDGGLGEGHWFDEQRLELLPGKKRITLDNSRARGADMEAPTK